MVALNGSAKRLSAEPFGREMISPARKVLSRFWTLAAMLSSFASAQRPDVAGIELLCGRHASVLRRLRRAGGGESRIRCAEDLVHALERRQPQRFVDRAPSQLAL